MTHPPAPGPAVALRARFGEMPDCWLEVRCGPCGSAALLPILMLARRYGHGVQVGAILGRLSCKRCKARPSEVWLNEKPQREDRYGSKPGWSVPLIGAAVSGAVQDRGPARGQS